MKKLHDLKIVLSDCAQLSMTDCMKIKGGVGGDLRAKRPSGQSSETPPTDGIIGIGG